MQISRPCILIALLLLWGNTSAHAQGPEHITFRVIGLREGLPYGAVNCLLMDTRGLLWVGMRHGLATYDGHAFTPVTIGAEARPITPNQLVEDEEGAIWAVGKTEGVIRVDPVSHEARLVALPAELKGDAPILWPTAVGVGHPGTIIVGSSAGTFELHKGTGRFTPLLSSNGSALRIISNGFGFRPDEQRHGLWMCTQDQGLVFYDTRDQRLHERDGEHRISPLMGQVLTSVCLDPRGGIWAADNEKDEIVHWDAVSGHVERMDHLPGLPGTKVGDMMYMGTDGQGRLWGCSWDHGGFRYNTKDGTAIAFPVHDDRAGALPFGYIRDLYEGADGAIWLANLESIAIHDPNAPQVRVIDANAGITLQQDRSFGIGTLCASGDSVLWAATDPATVVRVDLRTEHVEHRVIADDRGRPVWVRGPLPSGDGAILNTTDGIWRINDRDLRFTRLELHGPDGRTLPHRLHSWLARDAQGMLWSAAGAEAFRFDPRTGLATWFKRDSTGAGWRGHGALSCGLGTADGRFWIAVGSSGLAVFDPVRGTWEEHGTEEVRGRLGSSWINAMVESPDGSLWLATNASGLVKYDPRTRRFTAYDQRHGFHVLSLSTVQCDRLGRVWVGSSEGVVCFDPRTERAVRVEVRTDQTFDDLSFGSCVATDGTLYYADFTHIIGFDPNRVRFGHTPPPPTVYRVEIDSAVVLPDDGRVVMRYDRSQLRMHFGTVLPPGHIVRYAARLIGSSWSESDDGTFTVRGLGPGEHGMELRLMNNEGVWSPMTRLHVSIAPPWWQTFWARAAFALAVAAAIVIVFRARLERIRGRERKEESVARQVNELKLQALRARMDPHFVFNSLNSIDRFILLQRSEEASRYLNRFARLIRLVLHQSERTTVQLKQEVEMLGYYLELEALRFSKPFTWSIDVDPALEDQDVRLPPMLVQPFVENAIWHGLQHKGEAGVLVVRFRLRAGDLVCIVEDDGVGREASARINAQRKRDHESMATRVAYGRLELLRMNAGSRSRVDIMDLHRPDGSPAGTRITILLPLDDEGDANELRG